MVIRVPDQRKTPGGYAALDDRLLVLDFQAGNPQAFVEIHNRYGALARHVCQRFLPQQQDADEAFQETMIRVFQGLYRFNGRYALQPWIARIAKNVSLDHLRGRARRPQADDSAPASDELAMPGDEADEIVERLVQRDTVLSVLSDLPETHRRALMLREIEGRSHREVAQEMEISPSQAKALIHRAKGSFRRLWLEKVADRGGLMGFAFLPLLWLAQALERLPTGRGSGGLRGAERPGGRAGSGHVRGEHDGGPGGFERCRRAPGRGGHDLAPGRGRHGGRRQDRERPGRARSPRPRRGDAAAATGGADDRIVPPVDEDPRVKATGGKHEIKAEPPVVLPEPEPRRGARGPAVETPPGAEPGTVADTLARTHPGPGAGLVVRASRRRPNPSRRVRALRDGAAGRFAVRSRAGRLHVLAEHPRRHP